MNDKVSNLAPVEEWVKQHVARKSEAPLLLMRCAFSDDALVVRQHYNGGNSEGGLRVTVLRERGGKVTDQDVVLVKDGMIELLKVIHQYLEETR